MLRQERDFVDGLDEAGARRMLQDFLRDGVGARYEIIRLAEDLTGRYGLTIGDACRTVAVAIARGDLVLVRTSSTPEPLGRGDRPVEDLREIGGTPTFASTLGDDSPVAPIDGTRTAWVSFEVVDDEGRRADGDFRIALDADVREEELRRDVHRYDELRPEADVRLLVETTRWEHDAPIAHPRGDVDTGTSVSFEVVDDEGEPLAGRFELFVADSSVATGALDPGRPTRIRLEDATAATLRLDLSAGSRA